MFKKLIWKKEYLTGIDIIDKQHKDIITALNCLYRYLNTGKLDGKSIQNLITSIDCYTTIHFDTEEKMMLDSNYPDYEIHKKTHEYFKSTYSEITNNIFYNKNTNNWVFAIHLACILGDWLDIHILTIDMPMVRFLKS